MGIATSIFYVVLGAAALVAGGEALVRGAKKIAEKMKISPLVVGLTVVACCTSAPEMAVSFSAALQATPENPGVADVALGNVVGSNICNVFLILGVCALIRPLSASRQMVKRENPSMIAVSLATLLLAVCCVRPDGTHCLPRWAGALLLAGFVFYEWRTVRQAKRDEAAATGEKSEETATSVEPTAARTRSAALEWAVAFGAVALGLAFLVVGAKLFVGGAVTIARTVGVSEMAIGLTLVALGTSLPELTVSAIATLRGDTDVAVGNVVGSNVCNILLILGGTVLLVPGGMGISARSLCVDLPIMLGAAVLCGWFCFTGHKIQRWEGAVFVAAQLAYSVYLVQFAG
ncbi:MAG: calcium/sodium antiporter [Thermoguttaceae bacterium]|nr:calcium/sodium antiporter [Thermoguttaceae bacterium]